MSRRQVYNPKGEINYIVKVWTAWEKSEDDFILFSPTESAGFEEAVIEYRFETEFSYTNIDGGWVSNNSIRPTRPNDPELMSWEEYWNLSLNNIANPKLVCRRYTGNVPGWNGEAVLVLPRETPKALLPDLYNNWSVAGYGRYNQRGWMLEGNAIEQFFSPEDETWEVEVNWNDLSTWRE